MIGKMKKKARSVMDRVAGGLGYTRPKRAYQESQFPEDQFALIKATAAFQRSSNSLEVGCNMGRLVQMFSNEGKFAVGLDLAPYWAGRDNGRAILGVQKLDNESVGALPEFDLVCLLSVHHQWVASEGDQAAKNLMLSSAMKARHAFFVEFAAIASKYGYAARGAL